METEDYLNWDKDFQNDDNESALHIAISNDADIDTLKAILAKGVDVNVKNNSGKTPFECINHGSWKTALNLLQLERDFDLKDVNGNTFLHVLMDRVGDSIWGIRHNDDGEVQFGQTDQEQMISMFWAYILKHIEKFEINLNSRNKSGSTPLHIAADYWPSMKSLEEMLSSFEHVDPFNCDDDGNNFLHIYFVRPRWKDAPWFHDKLLKGRLKYLPKEKVCKLLNSQTTEEETPLHIFIKQDHEECLKDYEDILEAGADPSIGDCLGEMSLHCVLKKYKSSLEEIQEEVYIDDTVSHEFTNEVLKCLISHGANINATSAKGESPLFLAFNQEHISTLINLGADVNLKNKFSQTPLIYLVSKDTVNLESLTNLLSNGTDVNACDFHGNTVLHYIAWHGHHKDLLPALKACNIKVTRDKLGQLPCDVAYVQGHKAIFDELCTCKYGSHAHLDHFNLTADVIDLPKLIKMPNEFQDKLNCIRTYRNEELSTLLVLPGIGPVEFAGEAAAIKTATEEIVRRICEHITEKNDFLKCTIMQSGSVGENTKVNFPDEFDFVIILDTLGELCCIEEQQSDQEHVILKLKQDCPQISTECRQFFDDDLRLQTSAIRGELCEIIDTLFINEGPFQHPNISFVKGDIKSSISPTIEFSFYWKGCLYKDLLVSIDLVPACKIKGYWPRNSNLDCLGKERNYLEEEGALLLFQNDLTDTFEFDEHRLRISAMGAEKKHMISLPQVARDAYKVCKVLCNERICPKLHVRKEIPIKKVLTSYMLKNTLFHVMKKMNSEEVSEKSEQGDVEKQDTEDKRLLASVVRNIFITLLQFVKDEHLPAFIFPWQNVFTFNVNVHPVHNHWLCAMRYAFVKVILSMLGEEQNFSDIDETSCFKAVIDRHDVDEDDEDEELDGHDIDFEKRAFYYSLL